MKKLLLLLLLLPAFGFSQTASELLVRWEGTRENWGNPSVKPMYYTSASPSLNAPNAFMTASNVTNGSGISYSSGDVYGGFLYTNWPTGTALENSKYIQISITAGSGKKIEVKNLKFRHDQNCNSYKVIYFKSSTGVATDANFPTTGTTLSTVTGNAKSQNNTDKLLPMPEGYYVNPGETLFVRFYGYQVDATDNKWRLIHNSQTNNEANPNSLGPAIYGIISAAGGVTAVNDTASTLQNAAVNKDVLFNDLVIGTTVSAIAITQTSANGTATIQPNKTITFTPNNNVTGATTFKYKITGADGTQSEATVTVTVNPFVAPTANADTATTQENAPVTIAVLTNDTMGSSAVINTLTTSTPAHGTTTVTADKKVIYTPANGYTGADSFTYTITDANGKQGTTTVNITVIAFVPPTANADAVTTGKNIPATISPLANDTAGDGAITTVAVTAQPANGSAVVNGSTIVYTPAATFTGTNTISYKITDANGKFATATITVTVVAIQPVVAAEDNVTTAINTPVAIAVTANDNPGNSAITTVTIAANPAHGSVVVNGTSVTYTPTVNYTGLDSFTYTVKNAYNTTSTATVNITVLQPSANGVLCGTYYVGTNGDFKTITAAVAHLNQYGVSCAVTFLLKDNTYKNTGNGSNPNSETFPITINNFPGSSAVNTVTFKPAPNKNVRIEAFRDNVTGEYTGVPATFILNGADNIVFDGSNVANGTTRNMFILNSSFAGPSNHSNDYTDRAVIWLASPDAANGSTNIAIKYLQIRQSYKNTQDNYCYGIYAGSNALMGSNEISFTEGNAAHSKISIIGNDFMNVKQAIYINGNSSNLSNNITISQNDLGAENNTETIILPVALNNVDTFEVSDNLIYKLIRDNTAADLMAAGVYIDGNTKNGSIVKNEFDDLTRETVNALTFAAVVLSSNYSNSNILVANNFINNVSALGNSGGYSNGYGIIADNGGGYRILHNTVVLTTNQPQSGYTAPLYVNSGVTGLDVRNNIFANNQTNTATRRSAIMVFNDVDNINSVFTHLDYNNYYSADRIGYIANIHDVNITWPENPDFVTTLSGWKAALASSSNSVNTNNDDTHSVTFNTVFVASNDLHLAEGNGPIDNEGIYIAEVNKDIDWQLRKTTGVSIGADEYGEMDTPAAGSNAGIYCASSTTWNGTVWSNGEPTSEKDAIFTGNFTQNGGNLFACSLFVKGTAQVKFTGDCNALIVHNVNVVSTASLTFESNSNLIQEQNTQNVGKVTVKRNSSKLKLLDYTLWGSPVTGNQTMLQFSPQTATNRFYYYNVSTNQYIAYANPATTTFSKGKGYLIRVPANHPANTPTIFAGVFKGTPNNGNVYTPLTYLSTTQSYNAVGNPYPSPISVTAFIDANVDNIEGTLYMWRKTNDPTKTSYSTVTKIGYTANAAPGGTNELVSDPFEIDPSGVLNTGQGFLVKAKNNQNLVFRNNMRKAVNSNKFFRSAAAVANATPALDMSRIWLNVTNETDAFSQAMIAYTSIATEDYDNGIDGKSLLDGGITLYSVLPEYQLAIQARPEFAVTDIVPLGFKTNTAGTFKIAIDHTDGLFDQQQQTVYIKDNVTGTTHNVTEGPYSFTSETGTFNTRFEVVYQAVALGTDDPVIAAKDIIIYKDNKQVKITSPEMIKSVTVYDILGKVIYQKNNVGALEFATSELTAEQQMLIVKVTLDNSQSVSKKIIMN